MGRVHRVDVALDSFAVSGLFEASVRSFRNAESKVERFPLQLESTMVLKNSPLKRRATLFL